jgi:hypothetical protein
MDYILHIWNVQTACCNIGTDQKRAVNVNRDIRVAKLNRLWVDTLDGSLEPV